MDSNWFDGLTEKQRRFVEVFASNGGNAMAAARAAGYSNPQQEGYRQIEKAGIRQAIEIMRKAITSKSIMTREERQSFWSAVARGETDAGMNERLRASELLGKSQADFLDRVEHTGAVDIAGLIEQRRSARAKK